MAQDSPAAPTVKSSPRNPLSYKLQRMLLRYSPDAWFKFACGKPRSTTSAGAAANTGATTTIPSANQYKQVLHRLRACIGFILLPRFENGNSSFLPHRYFDRFRRQQAHVASA